LKFGAEAVFELWLDRRRRDRRLQELVSLAQSAQIPVRHIDRDDLDSATDGANHQGVVAWVQMASARSEQDLADILAAAEEPPLLLVLDGVTDPHNLGACLRSADGAGATAVIAPKDKAAGLTPVAVKVASGAAETMPFVQVTNLARTLDTLKEEGIWLVGLSDDAPRSLYETDLSGPVALVLGNEGSGLRRLTRERCDYLAALPMRGRVESLNVSVASGICLYEVARRRLQG
jgi:23S rRNA (guanosine2251-2'-O)-methyltransferase